MRIQLLGPVRAFTDVNEEVPVGGPKQRAVLARLAITPHGAVSVDQLIEAVWGQDSPQRANRTLATYVSNLRKVTGLGIAGSTGSYTLEIDRSAVDLCVFEDELARHTGTGESAGNGSATLRRAVNLFVGMPFADVDQHGSFTAETVRLEELRLSALEEVLDNDVRAGRGKQAIAELEKLVADHPDREGFRGLLMRALYATGRQTEALKLYETYRLRLQDDLGLDPSPELRNLELAILDHDDSLTQSASSEQGDHPQRRLPTRYSSFVGRQEEIRRVQQSLDDRRLITIVGPGGIGKSSIALESVRGASLPYQYEIVQTAFETVEAGAVGSSLAEAMGLQPAGEVDPVDVITGYIGDRPYLLILDGCEAHLSDVAMTVNRILVAAPACRVVATSREPLMLPGERIVRVDGLPIGDAIELFADRADLDKPLPKSVATTVGSVCEALDGMVLAIELAAARARSIPLEELKQRVDRQMPLLKRLAAGAGRHDSMAQAIQWSTDLLTESEKSAYRWLSVFSTGFRLRDANGVLATSEANDLVARLVEVSLLQPADANGEYRYLEPIRQHAVSELEKAGELNSAHEAHAKWMVAVARSAFIDEWSPRRRAMRTWLFRRRGEFLNAVRWASANGQPDLAIAIFAAIGKIVWSFEDIGHILQSMITAFDDARATQSPELAIALADAAWALKAYDRPDDAVKFTDRAETIVASFDDESPNVLRAKGAVMARRAIMDCPEIVRDSDLELANRAIDMLERAQSPNAGSFAINRANLLYWSYRSSEATEVFETANAWYLRATGRPSPLSLNHLALVAAREHGDWETAQSYARQAARIQIEDHDNLGAIGSYYVMGYVAMLCGRSMAEPAERLQHMARITGTRPPFMIDMWHFGEVGDSTAVMRLAKRWFETRTWHTVDNTEYVSHDMELTVYGDEKSPPRIFTVLLPIARALEAAGRIEDARAIAREIPSLVEQARITDWGTFDYLKIWHDERLRLAVGPPTGTTLQQMFDRVHDIVYNYAEDSSASIGIPDTAVHPTDGEGAPPSFTRIRDV